MHRDAPYAGCGSMHPTLAFGLIVDRRFRTMVLPSIIEECPMQRKGLAIVLCLAASLWFVSGEASNANAVSQAQSSLRLWNPLRVVQTGNVLTVVLNEQRITSQIYQAVIQSGICVGVLAGRNLPGIEYIQVVNRFRAQGFVYERGTEDCDEINNLPSGDSRIGQMIFLNSHTF